MAGGRKGKPAAATAAATTAAVTAAAAATPAATAAAPRRTLVLDNGAFTIKGGVLGGGGDDGGLAQPVVIPNCLARDRQRRTYIGSELAQCRDFGEAVFRRPVEKGYVVNWEAERAIWAHELGTDRSPDAGGLPPPPLACDPAETRLVLTEQPNALPALQAHCDQMVFEEFQFASYYRGPAAQFCAYLDLGAGTAATPPPAGPAEIRVVVDAGYSFTTVTPVLRGRPVHRAVRRLDVGGKLLTNYLTKLLSVRHYDMRHDPYLVNEIKEKTCYVALDFAGDLDKTWAGPRASGASGGQSDADRRRRAVFRAGSAGIAKEYVLPDYQTRSAGVVRDYDPAAAAARRRGGGAHGGGGAGGAGTGGEGAAAGAAGAAGAVDVLVLRNERFAVPEVLFHPGDVGLRQPGLADVVVQSVRCLPAGLWPAALANLVVVGGCAELPGLVQRLQQEVQARMPDDLVVRVTRPADPVTCTWRGAARWAAHPDHAAAVDRLCVTKQEYDEHGAAWVARKLAAGLPL